jgi:hypothetical protein
VAVPINMLGRNNMMVCVGFNNCAIPNADPAAEQYMGTVGIQNGQVFLSYYTYRPGANEVASRYSVHAFSQAVPPQWGQWAGTVLTTGSSTERWATSSSACYPFPCLLAGYYHSLSIIPQSSPYPSAVIPFIQQSSAGPIGGNQGVADLFTIFTHRVSAGALLYAPFADSVEPVGNTKGDRAAVPTGPSSLPFSNQTPPGPVAASSASIAGNTIRISSLADLQRFEVKLRPDQLGPSPGDGMRARRLSPREMRRK